MKESRARFYAGCAGGFGFYFAWQLLSLLWQTVTPREAAIKAGIGFVVGLVTGVLLYLGVDAFARKKLEVAKSKGSARNTASGVVAGLVVGFLFGLLMSNVFFT